VLPAAPTTPAAPTPPAAPTNRFVGAATVPTAPINHFRAKKIKFTIQIRPEHIFFMPTVQLLRSIQKQTKVFDPLSTQLTKSHLDGWLIVQQHNVS